MEYNFKKIGKRIKEERKKAGYKSQDALIDALRDKGFAVGRNTISDIENGKTADYDFSLLIAMSELFECDIGYLLCHYDAKTETIQDICDHTGLSPKAVNLLINHKDKPEYGIVNSLIITDNSNILSKMIDYLYDPPTVPLRISVMSNDFNIGADFSGTPDEWNKYMDSISNKEKYDSCEVITYDGKSLDILPDESHAIVKINGDISLTSDIIRKNRYDKLIRAIEELYNKCSCGHIEELL